MHTGQTEATSGNKGLNMKNVQWTAQIISQSVTSHANQNFPILKVDLPHCPSLLEEKKQPSSCTLFPIFT